MGLNKQQREELRRKKSAELYANMYKLAAIKLNTKKFNANKFNDDKFIAQNNNGEHHSGFASKNLNCDSTSDLEEIFDANAILDAMHTDVQTQNEQNLQVLEAKKACLVGLDEVGRGPLAGPLCVAAVILPDDPQIVGLDDSKKVTPKRREVLAEEIEAHATSIGLSFIESSFIDKCGMSKALLKAFSEALDSCIAKLNKTTSKVDDASKADDASNICPDVVFVDGNPLHIHKNEVNVLKGDAKIACISAASIYAKVKRDALMQVYAKRYPEYGFDKHKGYGTATHIEAIKKFGPCPIHRRSFLSNILSQS